MMRSGQPKGALQVRIPRDSGQAKPKSAAPKAPEEGKARFGIPAGHVEKLAQTLKSEINASRDAKRELEQVWAEVRRMQKGRALDSSVQIIEGMTGFIFPEYRQRRNRVVDQTYATITSLSPTVQCIDESPDGTNVDRLESVLDSIADRGAFKKALKECLGWAVDTNCATMRVTPLVKDDVVIGVNIENIGPTRFIGYPVGYQDYDDLKTLGHCYFDMVYRVKEKCESGEYDCDPELIHGGADPLEFDLATKRLDNSSSPERLEVIEDSEDKYVCIYELISDIRLDPESSKRTRMAITFDYDDGQILRMEEYGARKSNGKIEPYPIWYVPYRALLDSEEGLWQTDSVGRPCIHQQHAYTMCCNTILQGGVMAAFPLTFIIGGALKSRMTQTKPGTTWELPADIEVKQITNNFNASNFEFMLDRIEKIMDSLVGITQLGVGENIPASTAATTVNAMQAAQSAQKDAYIDAIAPSVAKTYELIFTFLKIHFDDIKKSNPKRVDIDRKWLEDLSIRFEVTGQSGASNPQSLLGKLMAIYAVLTDGKVLDPGSPYDLNKLRAKIIEGFDLPFSEKSIMNDALLSVPDQLHGLIQILQNEGYTPVEIKFAIQQLMMQIAQAKAMAQEQQAQQSQQGSVAGAQPGQPNGQQAQQVQPTPGGPAGALSASPAASDLNGGAPGQAFGGQGSPNASGMGNDAGALIGAGATDDQSIDNGVNGA